MINTHDYSVDDMCRFVDNNNEVISAAALNTTKVLLMMIGKRELLE